MSDIYYEADADDQRYVEEMAQELRAALTEHAEEPAVHCWLGVAERELGMEGIAYERFKAALALQPEDPTILALAGSGIAAFDGPEEPVYIRLAEHEGSIFLDLGNRSWQAVQITPAGWKVCPGPNSWGCRDRQERQRRQTGARRVSAAGGISRHRRRPPDSPQRRQDRGPRCRQRHRLGAG